MAARRAASALSRITPQLQTRETSTMPNTRLPDCKPPRREDSITSASSHPELLIGEIIMRPRIRIPLSAAERAVMSTWRRRVLAVYALLAAALAGYLVLTPNTRTTAQGVSKDEQVRAETCVPHNAAGNAASNVSGRTAIRNAKPACPAADDRAN